MPSHVSPPTRVLFLRPDTYGDLVLFEPVLRRLRAAWGSRTEIGVLIREPFLDFAPLVDVPGVRWLTLDANPYLDPVDSRAAAAALNGLRGILGKTFPPDCLVAPCSGKTWLEAAAGMLLPGARQVGLRRFDLDPAVLEATALALGLTSIAGVPVLFPEAVDADPDAPEWRQQAAVADHLLGETAMNGEDLPRLVVPPDARAAAGAVLAAAGLTAGNYVVCAAAGVANVQIKAWPPERFGEILAWLGRDHGVPALLVGHEREAERLETARQAARAIGVGPEPVLWLGRDGEMPLLAALIGSARFYLGNDTGAIHLAAALDRPLVGVYGGGAGLRFRPAARSRSWTVVQPLPCFGCAWDCFFGDAPCVSAIAPESVRGALERLLAAERNGRDSAPEIVEVGGLAPAVRAVVERVGPRFHAVRAESANRYRQVRELDALVQRFEREKDEVRATAAAEKKAVHVKFARVETDAAERLRQVEEVGDRLTEAETDRAARAAQVVELTNRLKESETDRDARAAQVAELTSLLTEAETDRAARAAQVVELTTRLKESETDRDARGGQVAELTKCLKESETDCMARAAQIADLMNWLKESETDRDARAAQVAELTSLLTEAETDRAARAAQVVELTTRLKESETDRDARAGQIAELTSLLTTSETDRAARAAQIAELTNWLKESEADRAARGEQIVELTALCRGLQSGAGMPPRPVPENA